MNYEDLSFPLEVPRKSGIAELSIAAGDAARFGKPNGSGLIDDNGLLIGIEQKMKFISAAKLLDDIYTRTRALPEHPNKNVGAASASALLIEEGIVVRSAGDASLLVLGDNGKVKLLNDFHAISKEVAAKLRKISRDQGNELSDTAYDETLMHSLRAGRGELGDDFTDFVPWEKLSDELGTENMRVLAVSDGIYGKMPEKLVAKHVERLLEGLKIDDPQFSRKVMRRTFKSETFMGKKDDIIILSAQRPEPNHTVLLHALDGIGGGRRASAEFADEAIEIAKNVMREQAVDIYLGEPDTELSSAELSGVSAAQGNQRT